MAKEKKVSIGLMQFIYWIINIGYAFKYWGFGWGIFNIFIPVALIWDLFQHLIKWIHPGLQP